MIYLCCRKAYYVLKQYFFPKGESMTKTIVFTGGGSAGHVTPNMALFPQLLSEGYDIH